MARTNSTQLPRELDARSCNGIEVRLLWHPGQASRITVEVADRSRDDAFTFDAPAARALDAFHHPYAYAAAQGIPYLAETPAAAGVDGL